MHEYAKRRAKDRSEIDREFLRRRLDAICEGLKEGVRREVARLRREGLPVYVIEDGNVVHRATPKIASL